MLRVAARVVKPVAGRRQLASLASLTQSLTGENTVTVRPLSQPFADLKLVSSKRSSASADAPPQVTTLDNGVRVASIESASGVVANLAVHVSAGSRVGPKFPTGIALLAARAGFMSTTSRSDFAVQRDLGAIGAKVDATATRGAITYSGSVAVDNATDLLAIIADTVHNSRYRKTEVGNVCADLANEVERESENRDIQLDDALHAAAYQNNTLGRPLWPTKDQIAALDVYALEKYTDAFYTPARTVVLGSGIPHEQLVRAAKELFNDSAFPPTRTVTSPSTPQYTGGDVRVPRRDAHLSLAIGFKNAPENSADVSALRVLQMWLEGPRTFAGPRFGGASAGGVSSHLVARTYVPGKLQAPAGVVAVGSAGSRFADGGVLALGGLLSKPAAAKQLIDHLVGAFKAAAAGGNLSGAELEVAKAQTIAEIFDERSAIENLEILAQQVVGASVASKAAQAAKIEAITEADITRVARQLLSSPVSVAAFGDVSYVPRYDEIAALFK